MGPESGSIFSAEEIAEIEGQSSEVAKKINIQVSEEANLLSLDEHVLSDTPNPDYMDLSDREKNGESHVDNLRRRIKDYKAEHGDNPGRDVNPFGRPRI